MAGDSVSPPTVESRLKVTLTPGRAPPRGINDFEDDRGGFAKTRALQPDGRRRRRYELNGADSGGGDSHGAGRCQVGTGDGRVAVMTSEPLQPFAVYVALTLPVLVCTVWAMSLRWCCPRRQPWRGPARYMGN